MQSSLLVFAGLAASKSLDRAPLCLRFSPCRSGKSGANLTASLSSCGPWRHGEPLPCIWCHIEQCLMQEPCRGATWGARHEPRATSHEPRATNYALSQSGKSGANLTAPLSSCGSLETWGASALHRVPYRTMPLRRSPVGAPRGAPATNHEPLATNHEPRTTLSPSPANPAPI